MARMNVYGSSQRQTEQAFIEVTNQMSNQSKVVLFFASTIYNFNLLVQLFNEKFPKAEVVGITTVGEIHNSGIHENSLVAVSMTGEDVRAKSVFMADIHKYPIFDRPKLLEAATSIGINVNAHNLQKEGIALVFPNGLVNAEERMLSVVNSIFPNSGFPVFGGTAGDDAKFEQTLVSSNGSISSTAGVVLFLKSNHSFKIYKESIFEQFSETTLVATKVDVEARRVYEFNGKKAVQEYARILGVTPNTLESKFMAHPLGFVGKQLSVGSPMCVHEDGSISFYCQILRNAELKILKPVEVLSTIENTVATVQKEFKQVEGAFAVNCILRKIQFKETKLLPSVNERLKNIPNLFGFCSYGEQLQNEQINQTLVLLVFGQLATEGYK